MRCSSSRGICCYCFVLTLTLAFDSTAQPASPPAPAAERPASDGDAACGKLLADVETRCNELAAAKAELEKLNLAHAPAAAGAAPGAEEAQARRKALLTTIEKSSQSPFTPWCGNVPKKVKPCDDLATLLEAEIEGLVERDASALTLPPTAGATDDSAKPDQPTEEAAAKAEYLAEPDRRTSTNAGGTVAQREPVEAVQPINLAGGAVSLAGTRIGTQGAAAITVNPFALAKPEDPALKRLLDVSVTAPFALEDASGRDTRFVGVRLRANATAPWSSAALRAELQRFYTLAGKVADDLEERLRRAPDVRGCALSIIATRQVLAATCGEGIDLTELQKARLESYDAIAAAQRQADRYYLGLDVRGDFGDPTGDVVVGDDGTSLGGAVAAGLRLPRGRDWDFELRIRTGGTYFHSRDTVDGFDPEPVFSFDWGAAVLLAGHATSATEKQRLTFGVGLEGRHTDETRSSGLARTNFVNLNAMVIVPVVSGADLGLSFSVPLEDSEVPRGTVIAVSTDLGLLDGSGTR